MQGKKWNNLSAIYTNHQVCATPQLEFKSTYERFIYTLEAQVEFLNSNPYRKVYIYGKRIKYGSYYIPTVYKFNTRNVFIL